jgi:uncharacterized membrane protein YhaH (DUF805 family)
MQPTNQYMSAMSLLFSFKGRINGSTLFIAGLLLNACLAVILFSGISVLAEQGIREMKVLTILGSLLGLPFIYTHTALIIKRLHDADKSGAWAALFWLFAIIPIINLAMAIILIALRGTAGQNRFGNVAQARWKGFVLAAIGLCVIATLSSLLYEKKHPREKTIENEIIGFGKDEAQQIDVFAADQKVTIVRNSKGEWTISHPRMLEADNSEINHLVDCASSIRRDYVLEANADDLARYGLDPAQFSLKLKTKDGTDKTIDFGFVNPMGHSTYALIHGSKKEVLLVPNSVADIFKKQLDDFRKHSERQ